MTDVYIVEHRQQRKGDKAMDSVVMGVYSTPYKALKAIEGLYPELRDSVRQDGPEWYFISRDEVDGQACSWFCAVDQNGMVSKHRQPTAGVFGPEDEAVPLADFMPPNPDHEFEGADCVKCGVFGPEGGDQEECKPPRLLTVALEGLPPYVQGDSLRVVTPGRTVSLAAMEVASDDDTVIYHTFSRAPTLDDAEALGVSDVSSIEDEVVERLALFPGVTYAPSEPGLLAPHRTPFRVAFRWTRARSEVWLLSCVSQEVEDDKDGGQTIGDFEMAIAWLKADPYYQEHLRKQREEQAK